MASTDLIVFVSQSFQLLLQYQILKYVTSTTTVSGRNSKNESTKRSSQAVLRSGTEKNMPVVLSIPVGESAVVDLQPDEIDRIIQKGDLKCPTALENWALK